MSSSGEIHLSAVTRGYGHHSPAAIIGMIYLCCGGITINLPTQS